MFRDKRRDILEELGGIIVSAVGLVGSICAVAFGWAAWRRNEKQDNRSGAREDGQLISDIGYIKSGVDDLKRRLERQEATNMEFASRLSRVESSASQAHKRIDELAHGSR